MSEFRRAKPRIRLSSGEWFELCGSYRDSARISLQKLLVFAIHNLRHRKRADKFWSRAR